jgi:hypothetical protein
MSDSFDRTRRVFQRMRERLALYSENAQRNLELLEKEIHQARLENIENVNRKLELFVQEFNDPHLERLVPPPFGERLLLLILTKEERVNIPGDLAEECKEIAAKHGERYARIWYYKQVAASAWPIIYKAIRWGGLAWAGDWIRRHIS